MTLTPQPQQQPFQQPPLTSYGTTVTTTMTTATATLPMNMAGSPPPPVGYQQQQQQLSQQPPMMIITTSAANSPLSVVQLGHGGPLVETLSESVYMDGTNGFALPTQLAQTLSLYGIQNSGTLISEMEQVIYNLNGMLREHYSRASNYDIGFWVSFTVLMILIILTMGLAVALLFIIYIFPYKKARYLVRNMNSVVRPKVQHYLTEINRTKLIPFGLEFVMSYVPSASAFSASQNVWGYSFSNSSERIVLKLIRVSKPVQTVVMQ